MTAVHLHLHLIYRLVHPTLKYHSWLIPSTRTTCFRKLWWFVFFLSPSWQHKTKSQVLNFVLLHNMFRPFGPDHMLTFSRNVCYIEPRPWNLKTRNSIRRKRIFLLDPFYRRGRVYKRKFCLSVCLCVCPPFWLIYLEDYLVLYTPLYSPV